MRLHRQCPHCKSKKGFTIMIQLGGYQEEKRDFNGGIIDVYRFGTDDEESANCLDCGKEIDIEKLQLD